MAAWLFEQPGTHLVNLGCGSGGLLIPAARHSRRRGCPVTGIDNDPLAIAMAKTNRRLRKLHHVDLEVSDFLHEGLAQPADRIICNPPYRRANLLSHDSRVLIHDSLKSFFGRRFSPRLSLQTLFLLRALEFTSNDARLAFITPANWLDVDSGAEARACLLEHAHVEALIFFEADHLFFEGPQTTALITLIRKGRAAAGPTKIVRLARDLPRPEQVLTSMRQPDVDVTALEPGVRWSRPAPRSQSGVQLGELARVHRGIATGANAYFCLAEDERERRRIDRELLRPCTTSPRVLRGELLTAETLEELGDNVRRWLVDIDDPAAESESSPLGIYLRRGRRLKIHRRYLPASRSLWYQQEQRGTAPILFTYFNKGRATVREESGGHRTSQQLARDRAPRRSRS